MFTFSDYNKLNRNLRSLITRVWIEHAKEELKVDKTEGLYQAIVARQQKTKPTVRNITPVWVRRKANGQPISHRVVYEMLVDLVPGTRQLFTHPFWHLLSEKQPSQERVQELISYLPHNHASRLLKVDRYGHQIFKPHIQDRTIYKIYEENNLSALTCLLALSLKHRQEEKSLSFLAHEAHIYNLLLRLSLLTPLRAGAIELYQYISELLVPNVSVAHVYDFFYEIIADFYIVRYPFGKTDIQQHLNNYRRLFNLCLANEKKRSAKLRAMNIIMGQLPCFECSAYFSDNKEQLAKEIKRIFSPFVKLKLKPNKTKSARCF